MHIKISSNIEVVGNSLDIDKAIEVIDRFNYENIEEFERDLEPFKEYELMLIRSQKIQVNIMKYLEKQKTKEGEWINSHT